MGCGILVRCRHCEANPAEEMGPYIGEVFQLGVGMMYSSLENVIDPLHYTRRSQVLDILHNHLVEDTECYHAMFHCPKCHRLHNRFYVKIVYDHDQVDETAYNCSKCRTRLEVIEEDDLSDIPCAECGQKTQYVDEEYMLMWD